RGPGGTARRGGTATTDGGHPSATATAAAAVRRSRCRTACTFVRSSYVQKRGSPAPSAVTDAIHISPPETIDGRTPMSEATPPALAWPSSGPEEKLSSSTPA